MAKTQAIQTDPCVDPCPPCCMGDVDQDCAEVLLESALSTHEALMTEIAGNSESSASIVRHSAARKFNEVDPIEAAAVEMIMQRARRG